MFSPHLFMSLHEGHVKHSGKDAKQRRAVHQRAPHRERLIRLGHQQRHEPSERHHVHPVQHEHYPTENVINFTAEQHQA